MKRKTASLARIAFLAIAPCAVAFSACSSDDSSGAPDSGAPDGARDVTTSDGALDANDANASGDDAQDSAPSLDAAANDGGDAALDAADAADALLACAPPTTSPTPINAPITTNLNFTCGFVYEISGIVTVEPPAVLSIGPGTLILMDAGASLIVKPGAKIMAVGTAQQPVLFTSAKAPGQRAPGDWGTLALVGKAPGNWGLDGAGHVTTQHTPDANDWPGGTFPVQAGGTDNNYADGSGTLRYVRLEYGGRPTNPDGSDPRDHEMLGMYGVGLGTRIDYVNMRQANFGCLFAEGGAFDASHLVCQFSGNGGFDFTRGNKSRAQFLLDQENPARGAEGLGIKGPFDGNQAQPTTDPKIYNVTVCGGNGGSSSKDPNGLLLRRQPAGQIYDFIATGFYTGLAMSGGPSIDGGIGVATTQLRSALLFGNFDPTLDGGTTNVAAPQPANDTDLVTWYANPQWHNATTNPGLADCFDASTLRAAPPTAITTNAASPPNDGFYDSSATYIGAFKDTTDTWTSGGWVVWSPN